MVYLQSFHHFGLTTTFTPCLTLTVLIFTTFPVLDTGNISYHA